MGSLEQVWQHRRVTSISDDVWSLITLAHEGLQTDMACCTATHATGGQPLGLVVRIRLTHACVAPRFPQRLR